MPGHEQLDEGRADRRADQRRMRIAEAFFDGGVREAQELLRNAILSGIEVAKLNLTDLDEMLRLTAEKLPGYSDILGDPSLLRGEHFCAIALPLNLSLDKALPLEADETVWSRVVDDMCDHHGWVRAACGPGQIDEVSLKDQAAIYALFRILDEIDASASS